MSASFSLDCGFIMNTRFSHSAGHPTPPQPPKSAQETPGVASNCGPGHRHQTTGVWHRGDETQASFP